MMNYAPLKFSANLSWLFTEQPFLDRFAEATSLGFTAVEFLFPYDYEVTDIQAQLTATGLTVALFNLPPGEIEAGEFGLLGVPARREAFRQGFETALELADRLTCRRLHAMVGKRVAEVPVEAQLACVQENLAWAAPQAAEAGITLTIESLNSTDMPNYLIHTTTESLAIVQQANQPNVKLQYDLYHGQMEGEAVRHRLREVIAHLGHIQLADVPGRHQPGSGEMNYGAIFQTLLDLNYEGYIGLEYRPTGSTRDSMGWLLG